MMASKATIVFIVYFIQGTLGLAVPESPTVGVAGGFTVGIRDVPFMASVHIGGYYSGGSIIHVQFVLTTAHFIKKVPSTSDYVRVGSSNVNTGGKMYSIQKYIPHEQYYKENPMKHSYDVGLIKLSRRLTFGTTVAPVKLTYSNLVYPGFKARISGWGLIGAGVQAKTLHEAFVTVAPLATCMNYYNNYRLTNKNICSRDLGAGACTGDIGGPLVVGDQQIGVYSSGDSKRGNCGFYPNIYVNVTAHIQWIHNNLLKYN